MKNSELFITINKASPNNSPFYSTINLINFFLNKCFDGTECDFLKKKYADYLFAYSLEEITSIQNNSTLEIPKRLFQKIIWIARAKTFNMRRKYYLQWINSLSQDKELIEDSFLQSLAYLYPKFEKKDEVRKLLGLNYSRDLIAENIKELK